MVSDSKDQEKDALPEAQRECGEAELSAVELTPCRVWCNKRNGAGEAKSPAGLKRSGRLEGSAELARWCEEVGGAA